MRIRIPVIAALLVGVAVLAGALIGRPETTLASDPAQEEKRTLSVTGQGTIEAAYDTAIITIGVQEMMETADGAYQAMARDMDAVVNALKRMGIEEEQLKTGVFRLDAQYDWIENRGRVLKGYMATNTLTVTTQELEQVPALVQAAVEAGATNIQGIRFTVKDREALLNQALDAAVDDAKAKAERVAERLGAEVVGVYQVSVNDGGRGPVEYRDVGIAGDAAVRDMKVAPAPIFSGSTEYRATVSVTFELR